MTIRHNILITGASSGLGEGMAREYARMGRNLAVSLAGRIPAVSHRLALQIAELNQPTP